MRGPGRAGSERPRARAFTGAAVLLLAMGGCAPWLPSTGRAGLPGGEWEVGVGLAWLAPVSPRVWDGLPVPQLWAARGLGRGAELRAAWAPPLSLEARVRLDVVDGTGSLVALHAGGGWLSFGGAYALPTGGVPFLRGGATLVRPSADGGGDAFFGSLELTALLRPSEVDRTAMALWGSAMVGLSTPQGDWRLTSQLGAIVSFTRPGRPLWSAGLAASRTP